jgi:HK97 family phage portal protein
VITVGGSYRPLAPQAFAETAPQFFSSYFVPRVGVQLATSFVTYGAMYQIQPWIHAVVDKIAMYMARIGVNVYDTSSGRGDVLDRTSPYARLMADPCYTVPPFNFYHWLVSTVEIYGEAFLIKSRDDNDRITSFIPMHPSNTQIHRSQTGDLCYRFMGRPNELIDEKEVVPFRRYNPHNTMRGLSRIEPLRLTLMNEDNARRASNAFFDNMGRPSMVLSTPRKLGKDGRERLQAAFDAQVGGADNAGNLLVLEDEVTATRMQLDASEMQYIDARRLNREEVCAVFDVAPPALRILDKATDANLESQFRDVYKDTIDPRAEMIASTFDYHVGSEFYGQRELRFNVAQQLRGDIEKLAPAAVQLINAGAAKPAEVRPWFDFDDAGPVANRLYANRALQPLGGPFLVYNEQGQLSPPGMSAPAAIEPGAAPTRNLAPPPNTGSLPQRLPTVTEKAAKYMRDIGGAIGGGKSWQEAAQRLLDTYPGDIDDIQTACLHILERNR